MEVIACRECRATIPPTKVLVEGRSGSLTCPECGMSECLVVLYVPEQISAATLAAALVEKEFFKERLHRSEDLVRGGVCADSVYSGDNAQNDAGNID